MLSLEILRYAFPRPSVSSLINPIGELVSTLYFANSLRPPLFLQLQPRGRTGEKPGRTSACYAAFESSCDVSTGLSGFDIFKLDPRGSSRSQYLIDMILALMASSEN